MIKLVFKLIGLFLVFFILGWVVFYYEYSDEISLMLNFGMGYEGLRGAVNETGGFGYIWMWLSVPISAVAAAAAVVIQEVTK